MKNKLLLPGALFVLAVLGCSSMTETKWEPVNEGGVTVQMPGKPNKQTQTAQTAVGPINVNMFMVDKGSEAYMMAYNEFPAAAAKAVGDPQVLLNNGRDGALRNVNGKLTSERPITLGSIPGRELIGEGTTSGKEVAFTARIYWANPRLIQIIYMREKSKAESPDGKKFLDSIQIQ
jgi:hypothetical protein